MKRESIILIIFFILFITESIALYSIKKYYILSSSINSSDLPNYKYLIISMICYGLIPILLLFLLHKSLNIGYINIIWNVMSNIYGLMIGIIIFSEVIYNTQWVGIILAFFGLFLIYYGDKKESKT
jgi:drug/metabolite transporter (DMT)-like permease